MAEPKRTSTHEQRKAWEKAKHERHRAEREKAVRRCPCCKRELDRANFTRAISGPRWNWCRACRLADADRRRGRANRLGIEITCALCSVTLPATLENFYKHPNSKHGLMTRCKKCYDTYVRTKNRISRNRLREELLLHYSGGDYIHCVCCGETRWEFMSLDHINGDGQKERESYSSANTYWASFRKRGFPPGYRTLCHNCNLAHGFFGYCPHERERAAAQQ